MPMGKHLYLNEDNAEETIEDCLIFLKAKVRQEARSQAFEDCTNYWKEGVEIIIRDNCPSGAKVSRIRQLFNIEYGGDE